MDERTLKALKKSIAHWEENVAAETPDDASTAADDCALCAEFNSGHTDQCNGCPVRNATGYRCCVGTPYMAAHTALSAWRQEPQNAELQAEWRTAAQAQFDFLKSLLPKEDGQ